MKPRKNFTQISNRLIRSAELSLCERGVFSLICSFSPSFPPYEYLQKVLGCSSRSISKAIRGLKEKGLIDYQRGGSMRGANLYRVLDDGNWAISELKSTRDSVDGTASSFPRKEAAFPQESASTFPGKDNALSLGKTNNTKKEYQVIREAGSLNSHLASDEGDEAKSAAQSNGAAPLPVVSPCAVLSTDAPEAAQDLARPSSTVNERLEEYLHRRRAEPPKRPAPTVEELSDNPLFQAAYGGREAALEALKDVS